MLQKKLLLLSLIPFFLGQASLAQSGLKFGVKIKPGNAIESFPNNKYTAIASGKNIVIVNNISGTISKTYQGHTSTITDLDINEDGNLLLSSANDKTLIIWDINSGLKKYHLKGHTKSVTKVQFISSDKVASLSTDNTLRIWDINSGKELNSFSDHKKNVHALAVGKNYIATGGSDGEIVLRAKNDGSLVNRFSVGTSSIRSLTFDLKGDKLISGTDDGMIKFWDPENGDLQGEINNGRGKINNISLAFDNIHLV